MGQHIRKLLGWNNQSSYVSRFLHQHNMHAAIFMCVIAIGLETWMILSFTRMLFDSAAAGKPRSLPWIISHGWWYVALLAAGIILLVHAIHFWQGKTQNVRRGKALVWLFCIVGLAFGIHFGSNSYMQGEQILAFVTMTLFIFGFMVWKPVTALIGSLVSFGLFYLVISSSTEVPMTYGTQVNLFTLWVATFVVALSAYSQVVSEAEKTKNLEQANEELNRIAMFDDLTSMPNMHGFNSAVSVLLEGIGAFDIEYAVLYMDIENFKSFNDKNGFGTGDHLLQDMGKGLLEIFAGELVARFSDDHFVAMCESRVEDERAQAANELLRSLRGDVRLHLKIGIYHPAMEEDMDVSQACDKARHACNEIKKHPGVYVNHYDDTLDNEVKRRQHVINNVKKAVTEGWIKVYYQPVVRCADGSGELCGYEALARWDDPVYGFMPPFAFIETLEEFREIDKLDRCIIEQVCRDLRAEIDAGKDVVPVSLNFSRLDFELYDVPAFLAEMSTKYNVPSELLDVEITESALTEQLNALQRDMSTLRHENHSLWLDDFGSGYSSLNVLKDFQFNVLKIDMAFLRGFENSQKSRPILEHIVSLAKELGMVTLCEGVETREQFEFLSSIGCDRAQGYHFGKPNAIKQPPAAA